MKIYKILDTKLSKLIIELDSLIKYNNKIHQTAGNIDDYQIISSAMLIEQAKKKALEKTYNIKLDNIILNNINKTKQYIRDAKDLSLILQDKLDLEDNFLNYDCGNNTSINCKKEILKNLDNIKKIINEINQMKGGELKNNIKNLALLSK